MFDMNCLIKDFNMVYGKWCEAYNTESNRRKINPK